MLFQDRERLIGSAWAFTDGGSALNIVVSTHQRFCDNIRARKITSQQDELFLGVTVAYQLDGKSNSWRHVVRDNRLGNRHKSFARAGGGGDVKVLGGTAAKGDSLRVQLRTTASGAMLNGVVTARGCGDLFAATDPVAEPAGVRLTVAGKVHKIRSVRVRHHRGGARALVLSTAPTGCRNRDEQGDAVLTIKHTTGSDPIDVYVAGDMYARSRAAKADLPKVVLELEQDHITSDFRFSVAFELKIGDYQVAVKAKGIAADCP